MEDFGYINDVPYAPIFQNGISLTKTNGVISYQSNKNNVLFLLTHVRYNSCSC